MFMQDDIKENLPLFLVELYHRTLGDGSVKVSMFDIGEYRSINYINYKL